MKCNSIKISIEGDNLKNHYVSQFIIKRFSNAINVFDIKTGRIDESKRPNKVFYKNDIFDEEIEKLCNYNIESRVANIINNKIIVDGNVVLTRIELETLKRYMLICSVRTQSPEFFNKFLLSFEKNADGYINLHPEYKILKKTKELKISSDELYLRTLKVFAKTSIIKDIVLNPLATREMLAWAMPFLESYIAFWDAPQGKEYILTDCGMCSEYEGFHMMTGGIDISKMSYLISQINNGNYQYAGLLASNHIMYENYNIYNLSSTRSMIMINPFFRLYHNLQVAFVDESNKLEKYVLKEPDIWPAIIQNRGLFDVPVNKYSHSLGPLTLYAPDDEFIYIPKTLTDEDLIYINTLMLSQTKEIIGFNDATKIIDSIYYFVWYSGNVNSVKYKNQPEDEVIQNFFDNIINSPFRDLCDYCNSKGGVNKTAFIFLFEKLLNNISKDFNENPYICEYYLNRPNETANCKALDFLGEGYKKLNTFKSILNRIKESRKNETI